MAFTDALDVSIGAATRASDYDNLADNTEFNREKTNAEHDLDISTGAGKHKSISFLNSTDVIALKAGSASLPSLTAEGDLNTGLFFPAADALGWALAGAEALRLNATGLGVGGAASYDLDVIGNVANYLVAFRNSNSGGATALFNFNGVSPDNNTQAFADFSDGTTTRLRIWSDGDLANHDGTYGTISDAKLKQDIENIRSYWADFSALKYRKFRHKSDVAADPDAAYRLGLVAQEVEKRKGAI
jgi:hypothetical protein